MEHAEVKFSIVENQRTIDKLITGWKGSLGSDIEKYRNHVYRVFNYAWFLRGYDAAEEEKLAIAAAFHDVGIWTNRTFDYIDPSIQLMRLYLLDNELEDWQEEISLMIRFHHKATPYKGQYAENVEAFRKADAIDLSMGVVRHGIPREMVQQIHNKFKNDGFHLRLLQEGARNFMKNPLKPFPMIRW